MEERVAPSWVREAPKEPGYYWVSRFGQVPVVSRVNEKGVHVFGDLVSYPIFAGEWVWFWSESIAMPTVSVP